MKATIFAVLALAAVALAAGAAPPQAPNPPPPPNQVHAQGCVQPGVEARCLVVKDVKSGILYDLLIKGARPRVGAGIEFTGVLHDGPTYCMQGIALDVISWAPSSSLKCAPGPASRQ